MTEPDSGRPPPEAFHYVEDEEQARMLMNEDVLRFFRPFLARETTVSEAAAEVGCKPSVMLYRVGIFIRAGLLRVVREEPRAGRAVKLYRSSHDAYLIPYALTPFATLEEVFYARNEASARRIARANARRYRERGWDGYRLYRNAFGDPWMEGTPDARKFIEITDPERSVGLDFTLDVHLTPEEAKELQAQLYAYLQRYQPHWSHKGHEGTQPFLFSVAFVPMDEEESQ